MNDRPSNLFEATNLIISLDKQCYLEENALLKNKTSYKERDFKKRHYENKRNDSKNKYNKKYKKYKTNEVLSANYTPNKTNSMTSIFTLKFDNKKLKIGVLIDSRSGRSFICENFIKSNKISYSIFFS